MESELTRLVQTLLNAIANGEMDVTLGQILEDHELTMLYGETGIASAVTFSEAGILSRNAGLVVQVGEETHQITVI